jgi:hypothetical protein
LDIFIEIIPELLALGMEQRAMTELDIVLHQYPYRLEPILHLYGALIFLKLSSPSQEVQDSTVQYKLRGVSEVDQAIAFIPHNLLTLRHRGDQHARSILREAERKFETVLNVGIDTRKRGRSLSAGSRSASQSRSRSRSRSKSRSRSRNRSRSKSRARARKEEPQTTEEEDDELAMATEDEEERPQIEIGNDKWARNVARAYLEVVSQRREDKSD